MPTVAQLNVDVEADIGGAVAGFAEVNALIAAFDRNRFADLEFRADITGVVNGFAAVQEMRDRLDGQTIVVDVDLRGAAPLLTRLDAIGAAVDRIDGNTAQLRVDVAGVASTLTQIGAVQAAANRLDGKRVKIHVDEEGAKGIVAQLGAVSFAATRASSSVRLMAAAVLTLAPAAIPALGAVAVGVMGIAGSFTAAGIGATLFGLTVTSVYKPVTDGVNKIRAAELELTRAITDEQREAALENLRQAWMQLTPAQAEAAQTLIDFRDSWTEFTLQFQPQIFDLVSTALSGLQGLFPRFGAILGPVIEMFQSLADRMFAALDTERGRAFFDWLATNAAPSLDALATGLGNIIAGFAGMLMAFTPLQEDFQGGFVEMTEKFREWGMTLGENQGFKDFVAYVRDNIPKVIDFFVSLWDAFTGLIRSLAPAGQWAIGFLRGILDAFKSLVTANPILTSLAALLVAVTIIALKMAAPLSNIIYMLLTTAGAFSAAGGAAGFFLRALGVGALLAFAGALLWAYTHLDGFKEIVDATFKAVAAIIKGMAPSFVFIAGAIAMLVPPIMELIGALLPLTPLALEIVAAFMPFIAVVVGLASVIAGELLRALAGIITPVAEWLAALLDSEGAILAIGTLLAMFFIPRMVRAGNEALTMAAKHVSAWLSMQRAAVGGMLTDAKAMAMKAAAWVKGAAVATREALVFQAAWIRSWAPGAARAVAGTARDLAKMVISWAVNAGKALVQAGRWVWAWWLTWGPGAAKAVAGAAVAFARIIGRWVAGAAAALVSAARFSAAWLMTWLGGGGAYRQTAAHLLAMARLWAISAAQNVGSALRSAQAWVIMNFGANSAIGKGMALLAGAVASWTAYATGAIVRAYEAAAAWVILTFGAGTAFRTQAALFAFSLRQWYAYALTSIASAGKAAMAWLITSVGAKTGLGIVIAAQLGMIAGWVKLAAVAVGKALVVAGAWLISMGPVALVIAAIALVAAAVWWVYKNWDGIVQWFANLWDNVVSIFQKASDWVMEIVTFGMHDAGAAGGESFTSGLMEGVDFGGFGTDMMGGLGDATSGLPGMMGGAGLDTVNGFSSGMLSGLGGVSGATGMIGGTVSSTMAVTDWYNALHDEGAATANGFARGMRESDAIAGGEIQRIPEQMTNRLAIGFSTTQYQVLAEAQRWFGDGITSGIDAAMPNLYNHLASTPGTLTEAMSKGLPGFQEVGIGVLTNVRLGYESMLPRISDLMNEMPAYLAGSIPKDPWSAEGRLWMEEVARGIRDGKFGLSNEVINLPWEVAAAIPAADKLFTDEGKAWMDAVGNGIVDGQVQIDALMSNLPAGASLILSNGTELFSTAGMKWADAVGSGVIDGQVNLNAMIAGLPPEAVALLAKATEEAGFPAIGEDWMAALGTGAEGAMPDIEALMADLPPGALEALGDTSGMFTQPGADMVSGLGEGITGEVATVTTAMASIQTEINAGWQRIVTETPTNFVNIRAAMALGFAGLKGETLMGMSQVRAGFAEGWIGVGQTVTAGFATMNLYMAGGFVALASTATVGMTSIQASISTGFVLINTGVGVSMAAIVLTVTTGFTSMGVTVTAQMMMIQATIVAGWAASGASVLVALNAMTATVTASFALMLAVITAALAAILATVTAALAATLAVTGSAMVAMIALWTVGMAVLVATTGAAGNAARGVWTSHMVSIVAVTGSAVSQVISAFYTRIGSVQAAAWNMASAALAGVAWLPGRMYSAGVAAGDAFADGLRSQIADVRDAAEALAGAAAGAMPGSPAEWGPLSGQGYVLLRGQRMAEDFARGMLSRTATVQAAAEALAVAPGGRAGAVAGLGGRGGDINISDVRVEVKVGAGADERSIKKALDDAGDILARKLADEIRRRGGG